MRFRKDETIRAPIVSAGLLRGHLAGYTFERAGAATLQGTGAGPWLSCKKARPRYRHRVDARDSVRLGAPQVRRATRGIDRCCLVQLEAQVAREVLNFQWPASSIR